MKIKEHNVETGEIIEREMTANEIAQVESDMLQIQLEAETLATKEEKKNALLVKLGITADEAKLLLL
jgi:hypothetical protein